MSLVPGRYCLSALVDRHVEWWLLERRLRLGHCLQESALPQLDPVLGSDGTSGIAQQSACQSNCMLSSRSIIIASGYSPSSCVIGSPNSSHQSRTVLGCASRAVATLATPWNAADMAPLLRSALLCLGMVPQYTPGVPVKYLVLESSGFRNSGVTPPL